jgi:hypothetical protein
MQAPEAIISFAKMTARDELLWNNARMTEGA